MTMRVEDAMTEDVRSVRPDDSLQVLRDLMYELNVRHIPVVTEDGELAGLVSHRDLLRHALVEQPDEAVPDVEDALERMTAADVMVPEVEAVTADADVREAAQIMFERKFGCLPVVEGNRLVGILTEADFVRLIASGA